jgi:Carboxypeptidase regulatory-like domain
MRTLAIAMAVAVGALACGSSSATPSGPTTPRWTIAGTVRDGDTHAIAGATVTISGSPLPVPVTTTITDANGRYTFSSVEQGTYFIGASAPGHVTEILPVTVTSAQTIDFTLPLSPR